MGAFTATIPMYVSESVNAKNRGKMVLLEGFFAIGGIVLASWIEFGLYYVKENSVSWRFPIAFQIPMLMILMAGVLFFPEVSFRFDERATLVTNILEVTTMAC